MNNGLFWEWRDVVAKNKLTQYIVPALKTFFFGAGAVLIATGVVMFGTAESLHTFGFIDEWLVRAIAGIVGTSVLYVRLFTRIPALWDKFKPRENSAAEISLEGIGPKEEKVSKGAWKKVVIAIVGFAAIIATFFLATHSFLSGDTLLRFFGITNQLWIDILCGYLFYLP